MCEHLSVKWTCLSVFPSSSDSIWMFPMDISREMSKWSSAMGLGKIWCRLAYTASGAILPWLEAHRTKGEASCWSSRWSNKVQILVLQNSVSHCEYTVSFSTLLCQVLSPLAKNLFHRAISESGVALTAGLVKKNTRPLAEVNSTLDSSCALLSSPLMSLSCYGIQLTFSMVGLIFGSQLGQALWALKLFGVNHSPLTQKFGVAVRVTLSTLHVSFFLVG